VLLSVACAPGLNADTPADLGRSTCETTAVLDLVNDSTTSAEALMALGVYSRGARGLVEARDAGAVFTTIDQIDDVKYIGNSSLNALYASVEGIPCDVALSCEVTAVLDLVNDDATTEDDLKAAGVYWRGARGIVSAHDEGVVFASIEDIDDVPYVGASSLAGLDTWSLGQCLGSAEVVFSPQYYSDSHLRRTQEHLASAQHTVDLAMYSFSDEGMYDALEETIDRGVHVRVIFDTTYEDRKDPQGTRSARIEDMGAEVVWVNKVMHHKFLIIDGPRDGLDQVGGATLITGSGNWSYSAGTKYDENTVFVQQDDKLILAFQREFNTMWSTSRVFEWNESIEHLPVSFEVTEQMIEEASGSEVYFTSANFRTYESSRYGWTFAANTGSHQVADRVAEFIDSATSSVWVASGHFRSKQIRDAILAKHQEDPSVDIRVYLDGQEWISQWSQDNEVDELEDCLSGATTENQSNKCYEVGRYWSKDLVDAGVATKFDYYAFRWNYRYAEQMHHKYIIVDGERVLSGSYNFSSNAEVDSLENTVVYDAASYPDLVDAYIDNHSALWVTGEADDLYSGVMDEIENGSGNFDIVWEPMALGWQQVQDLKDAVRDHCPDVNADPYRNEPASHQQCTRDQRY